MQRLSLEFAEADANQLPPPRQKYGIDFHGHAKGEILVAINLVTREVCLWLLPNRKQESVSRALLSGLVFVKGVPLEFRSDNAPELMSGIVSAMNHYLGLNRSPLVVTTPEVMPSSSDSCIPYGTCYESQPSNEKYSNLKDYLQCIAFAHNCTYSSVIECTPFEAGHGLRARTINEARMAIPKLNSWRRKPMICQKSTLVYLNLSFQLTVVRRVHAARDNTLYTVGEGKREVKERR